MSSAELLERARAALQGSDAEKAYALAGELCTMESENYQHQQLAGVAALFAERGDEAFTHFSHALRLVRLPPLAAAAWAGIGRARLLREELDEAEAAFRRALSLAPELPPALGGLAVALSRQGQYAEAAQIGKHALELGARDASLHVAVGQALLGQDEVDEAEEFFRKAETLEDANAEARFALGTIAKVRGRLDDALAIYREVLEKYPQFPGYGQFAALKTFTAQDEDIALMESALAGLTSEAPARARSDLHFALAKAWDEAGDAARAAEHLGAGNRLERERIGWDPSSSETTMRRIEKLFPREFIHRYENAGFVGIAPIFITSLPRSGTTLMEQMLASHSQITGGGELAHFARVANTLSLNWGQREDFPDIDPTTAFEDLRESGHEYARLTSRLRLLTPHFTDKSLLNIHYIGLIRMMLPAAKIIHMRRHPLATAFGIWRQRFTRSLGYSFDLEHIVRHYRAYTALMQHWRSAVPEAFCEVFYEALVADPEGELRRTFDYLGLEFEPACLEFYNLDRPVRTASLGQVRQPLDRRGLERHRHYGEVLAPVAEGLAEEIADYEQALHAALKKDGRPWSPAAG
ncbi:MAG: sulfotransferase [Gammaproteobacteria bacterium]|nr:sulfotransferase [Gammaproteobacteria bacterium]